MTARMLLTRVKDSPSPIGFLLFYAALALLGPPCGAAVPGLHTATDGSGMPLALFDPPIPTPVWLHAAAAVGEDGALRRGLMYPEIADSLETLLSQSPAGGCILKGHVYDDRLPGWHRGEDLDDILRVAPYVLLARVTGLAQGLSVDTPGTLVRLEPVRAVRGQWKGPGPYYVFMPVGRVTLGSKTVCKTDKEYSNPPALGDQLLIFSSGPSGEHRNLLYLERPSDLITLHEGHLSYAPAFLNKLGGDRGAHETVEDLLWRIDRYTLQTGGKPQ